RGHGLLESLGHSTEIRVLARRNDDGRSRATSDARAEERDARQLERQGRIGLLLDDELFYGEALARERPLDDEEVLRLDHAHVARNHVACDELHHVAGDDMRYVDLLRRPIAEHRRMDRYLRIQLGSGSAHRGFLAN